MLVARASAAREQLHLLGWSSAPRGLPSARGALEGTLMSLRAVWRQGVTMGGCACRMDVSCFVLLLGLSRA